MQGTRLTDEECDIEGCNGHYVKSEGNAAVEEKWCDTCYFVPSGDYLREKSVDSWHEFVEWRKSSEYRKRYGRTRPHGGFYEAYPPGYHTEVRDAL